MSPLFGAGNLGSLIVKIEADLTNLNRGLTQAEARVQKSSGRILANTQQIGRNMTLMGAAIVGAMALVTKAAIDFEDAFAGVRKTVDATEAEFAQLAEGLREMSTEIPVTAVELARIQEIAGQLGIRGVESLEKFTETIAFLSVTTNLTAEAAATDLARIANVMQEPIENIDRMGAAVVDLGNNAATTEAEIVSFANRITGAGKVAGLTTADLFAFGAAFTSVGIRAERGGTAVNKALILMATSVEEGGGKLSEFASIAGLSSEDFVKAYKDNPGKAFALFIEGLGKAGLKGKQLLADLGLGNERLIQSFLSVGGAGGLLTEQIKRSSEAWEENAALLIEAEKRFATTASQIKLVINNIVEVARKIGDTLLPVLRPMLEDFQEWVQRIGEFIGEHPKLIASIAKLTTGFGLLLLVVGPFLIILPQIVQSITFLKVAITLLNVKLIALKLSLSTLGPIAIAAFAGWKLGELIRRVTGLDEALSGPDGLFTNMLKWLDMIAKKIEPLIEFIERIERFTPGGILRSLRENAPTTETVGPGQPGFGTEGAPIELGDLDILREGINTIQEAINDMVSSLKIGWASAMKTIGDSLLTFEEIVESVVVTSHKGFAKAITDSITGTKKFEDSVKDLGKALIEMIVQWFAEWLVHQLLAKAVVAANLAFTKVIAAAAALAWAPAAALASLATVGTNAVPAQAALVSTTALATLLAIPKAGEGAIVTKPTILLAGEKGPERLTPLGKEGGVGSRTINIIMEEVNIRNSEGLDIEELAEELGENIKEKLEGF